ncbi:MAG: hypothetical protein KatS3mg097_392 [Candidatus Parcubacteria bacterium]|nr:MAG: hypothetical protein KatS3mg097_392 [Candidatus Parcubacteria bacterium]
MKTRQQKQQAISELSDLFQRSKGYLIVNILNLNSEQQTKLKEALKDNNALFKVVKKSLIYKAFPDFAIKDNELKFPFAFIYDFDENLKCLQVIKSLKNENINIDLEKGYLWDRIFSKEDLAVIVNLPSKDELLRDLLSVLAKNLYYLHYALTFPMQKLLLTLSFINNKKT